jgi:CubicO group peptidase (beta-lactamase class C family)
MSDRASRALDFVLEDISPDGPGAAIAIVQGEAVLAERTRGLVHPARGARWTRDTRARIASLSKPMAAQVILALVGEGALDLEARAGDYLAWLSAPQADVTLRQMLNMRSGLLEEFPLVFLAAGGAENHHSLDERLALIATQTRLNFRPGERTLYANTGYTLLQCIAEAVSGLSYGALLDRFVTAPAGMSDTTFMATDAWASGELGIGHSRREDRLQPFDYFAEATAASGVVSTLSDLLKWHASLRRDRRWADMAAPAADQEGRGLTYGLGVERKRLSGHATLGHSGGLRGWASDYVSLPALDAAAIVLANRNDLNWYERIREALCLTFDLAPDPTATPRLVASERPAPLWRASYVDLAEGHAISLSGGDAELDYEGRRLPRDIDGAFRRSLGVEPISFEPGPIADAAPIHIKVTEGDRVASYSLADPTLADASAVTGVYATSCLPGRIAIAEIEGAVRVLVGPDWPQEEPLILKPLSRRIWRAYSADGERPLDLHLFWPDLERHPDILHVTMTRLLRYPYLRVGAAGDATALFRWTSVRKRRSA